MGKEEESPSKRILTSSACTQRGRIFEDLKLNLFTSRSVVAIEITITIKLKAAGINFTNICLFKNCRCTKLQLNPVMRTT